MRVPAPIRRGAKRLITALASRPFFAPAASAAVHRLNRRTAMRLRRTKGVMKVYFRGSYARGTFVPFASDVDLALILSDDAGATLPGVLAIHKTLRSERLRNPGLRDWWHHLILESEWPVVEAFCPLYGAAEWRDEEGRPPVMRPSSVSPRLFQAASWAQLCLWSGSASHAFIHGEDIHSAESGLKKSAAFARRMGLADPVDSVTGVYRALEAGARLMNAPSPVAGERSFRTERAQFIVWPDGLSDTELSRRWAALKGRSWPPVRVTYVLPASALGVWPVPAERVVEGELPAPLPADRAREILLHEALFLPSAFRLASAGPNAASRLRHAVASLERAVAIYEGGRLVPENGGDVDSLFRAGSALCARLQAALLRNARERRT